MDEQLFDPERVFSTLRARGVEYVVAGGLAVQAHGHVRTTVDLDLIPKPVRANLVRLAAALNDLDARVVNEGSEGIAIDANMLPRATLWRFETLAGAVDVLHDVPGGASFDLLLHGALQVQLDDLVIPFVGREDLIRMKRAAGRPRDLSDVAALTEPDEER